VFCVRSNRVRCWLGSVSDRRRTFHGTPGGALAKACDYTLSLCDKFRRFLEYPELELCNNLAENPMRPVALGRKHWVHIGRPQASPEIAVILP
jgi:hypothetical protein